ncbi:hypothetical protein CYMTET_49155 [Cymbomonas tetramitiformis]|uniref:Uncharacterized protein n=1 Tax=Cymbomonas tetramitiformis TaxID=36881 RepID=A0AAE0BS20_9CHLO|nr:hypothetical protein CYMTET_49155 [Cymbomonas tetramitiformis]
MRGVLFDEDGVHFYKLALFENMCSRLPDEDTESICDRLSSYFQMDGDAFDRRGVAKMINCLMRWKVCLVMANYNYPRVDLSELAAHPRVLMPNHPAHSAVMVSKVHRAVRDRFGHAAVRDRHARVDRATWLRDALDLCIQMWETLVGDEHRNHVSHIRFLYGRTTRLNDAILRVINNAAYGFPRHVRVALAASNVEFALSNSTDAVEDIEVEDC